MTQDEFQRLREGDVVQSGSGEGYVIILNRGRSKIAVRSVEMTNPSEWTLIPSSPATSR